MPKKVHGNNWKGGRIIDDKGYVGIYMPEHPRSRPNGYVREHIILAENAIGRPLPQKAQIHHHGERCDNSQIIICPDQTYHFMLHTRAMALRACGNANWRKCRFCQEYDDPQNLYIKHKGHGWHIYHRKCINEYHKSQYIKNKESINEYRRNQYIKKADRQ